ncbi:hypothetical protein [Saccharopolyspora pogona]|uniref:hypothetical protein n=1 Tax=Saccharopolyspora pogona TaxID=333966 RepID=UPI00168A3809|nr:hypothetical protein [Saccharopolyspora pogona]
MPAVVTTLLVVAAGAVIGLVVGLISQSVRAKRKDSGENRRVRTPGQLAGIGAIASGLAWAVLQAFPQTAPFR